MTAQERHDINEFHALSVRVASFLGLAGSNYPAKKYIESKKAEAIASAEKVQKVLEDAIGDSIGYISFAEMYQIAIDTGVEFPNLWDWGMVATKGRVAAGRECYEKRIVNMAKADAESYIEGEFPGYLSAERKVFGG